ADALKTATQNGGNTYYAGRIIYESRDTIGKIGAYLGAQARNEPLIPLGFDPEGMLPPGPTSAETEFNRIYADLSRSVKAATTLTVSHGSNGQVSLSLSPDGMAAADLVANSLARDAPKDPQNWLYQGAGMNAIAGGDGAALTLAAAAALKQQGDASF